MTKKNRFSMLEVDKSEDEIISTDLTDEVKRTPQPKQFKVVVEADEFRKNLEQHRLTEKIKTIEKKKIEIKIDTKRIRQFAYLKILIGCIIIFYSFDRYIFPRFHSIKYVETARGTDDVTIMKDSMMTTENYIILGALVILFSYIYLSDKNKGKK